MQDFKRLKVWHKAHACFVSVHRLLGTGPTGTSYYVRAQALRSAASIPANIAEGCGKTSNKEYIRFLDIAIGSARELENHLLAARDIGLVTPLQFAPVNAATVEVQRMLVGLIRALRAQAPKAN